MGDRMNFINATWFSFSSFLGTRRAWHLYYDAVLSPNYGSRLSVEHYQTFIVHILEKKKWSVCEFLDLPVF